MQHIGRCSLNNTQSECAGVVRLADNSTRAADRQLEIVTVLFGGLPTLCETLPTWIQAVDGTAVGLRFVDNWPTTDAEQLLHRLAVGTSVKVAYTHSPDNPGFAASANRLIRESQSKWLLLVNPDVYLHRAAVDAVLEYVSNADSLSPAAVSMRTNGRVTSGVELSWYGYFGDRQVPTRRACLGPSGGAAVLPVIECCENDWFFEEDLFAWGEDAGLAVRLFAAGVRTTELDLALDHVGGHSVASPAGQRLKARLLARNRLLVLRREFSVPFRLTVGGLMVGAMLLNGIRKARSGTAYSHFQGMLEAIRSEHAQSSARPRMGLGQFIRYSRSGTR
jgi:N-acetylglucosaminyl-diphospho-decaprenol L-rhamnosyltransferase